MYKLFIKRAIDILISSTMIGILLPLLLIISFILIFIHKGSPFFIQERPGKNERPFKMIKFKTMIDRELISKKYNLLLVNSGLLYRFGSKLIIKHKPKNNLSFLKKKFKNVSYRTIAKENLHSEEISNHVAILAKNKKVREIINKFQKKLLNLIKKYALREEI